MELMRKILQKFAVRIARQDRLNDAATVSSVDVEPVSGIFALCMVWHTVFLTRYRVFCCFAVFSARLFDSSSLSLALSHSICSAAFIRFAELYNIGKNKREELLIAF